MHCRETHRILQIPHRDLQGSVHPGILLLMRKELIRKIKWLRHPRIKSQNCISIKFPDHHSFQCWKTNIKTKVCSCSSFPTDAVLWIRKVEMAKSVDDLVTSQSIGVKRFSNFEKLDAKITYAPKKIISNPHLKRRVNLEEQ